MAIQSIFLFDNVELVSLLVQVLAVFDAATGIVFLFRQQLLKLSQSLLQQVVDLFSVTSTLVVSLGRRTKDF